MNWKKILLYSTFLIHINALWSQYKFSGYVDTKNEEGTIYLSLIEDYRKISGIYPEQIIQKTEADSTGYFSFEGNNLPLQNRIYRIHTENCSERGSSIHFNGICKDSNEILFIANNKDIISLPYTTDNEMFCKIISDNERSKTFLKVDSIIEDMRYAFSSYRSEANRKVNSKKWVGTLQQYGKKTNEPLTELYIYSFISNKSNNLYSYYLKDLRVNSYYDDLLRRLGEQYPNTTYFNLYNRELASDRFSIKVLKKDNSNLWFLSILFLLFISIIINIMQFLHSKKKRLDNKLKNRKLTSQEKKILDLILSDKTNKEIATIMYVSISTVKTHINNLYKKLDVTSRDEVKSLYSK